MKLRSRNSILIFFYLFFLLPANAVKQVLKIEHARDLTEHEVQFFPEKIPQGCHPIVVDVYVNDDMINQLKNEMDMHHDDFFVKEMYGKKIKFIYFEKNCHTKKSINSVSSYLKIKNEVEKWLILNKPK